MKSLKKLLLSGPGPSSSHTIGPFRIVKDFLSRIESLPIKRVEVTLLGSLALTGKGHFTDQIILKAFEQVPVKVLFSNRLEGLKHPNTMELIAYGEKDEILLEKTYLSIGGGAYQVLGEEDRLKEVYPFSTFHGLLSFMEENNIDDVYQVIEKFEDDDIFEYGKALLLQSFHTIQSSLLKDDILPGDLKLHAVSGKMIEKAKAAKDPVEKRLLLLTSYAYATSEANARGEMVVTSPTCGAAGVVPSVLYYEYKHHHFSLEKLTKAYLVGALVCDFIKENAGVSGALLGCQAEIGSASSFASASLAYLHSLSLAQIEYAAEVAMEHFLGLTCDPVNGYVQIPCIERNAIASIHSYSAYLFSKDISPYRKNKVSFDNVIQAMKETGTELPSDLKETSLGGLAKIIHC